jgi:hypothetical protein
LEVFTVQIEGVSGKSGSRPRDGTALAEATDRARKPEQTRVFEDDLKRCKRITVLAVYLVFAMTLYLLPPRV